MSLIGSTGVGQEMISLRGLSFLVVDDNRYMRNLLRGILAAFGTKDVREACDGADAFKELRHYGPDIIITDNYMSPLDGIEFTRMLRTGRDSPAPMVPIIMVTGYTDLHNVVAARDAGVHEFLAKPVSAHALYGRIHNVLTKPRPFVKSPAYFGPCRRRRSNQRDPKNERRHEIPELVEPGPIGRFGSLGIG
ncbi:response regulator [Novispirillum sp. DQ9]|uniref:response regulator n=1 Tax=Novispirillum sp. DQ9 TaxID=3398612 RepID=UPI003C7CD654